MNTIHDVNRKVLKMDIFEEKMQEELEFWRVQIKRAENQQDLAVLPRLRDALSLVEFKLERYRGKPPGTGIN